jgi:hypothetical protein
MLPDDETAVQEKNQVTSDHSMLKSKTGQISSGRNPTLLSISEF